MIRVLLVGKGEPERGGIPTHLGQLCAHRWTDIDVSLLNLAHGQAPEGGRVSVGNLSRTVRDVRRLRAAARDADVVHVHSALAPTSTMVRAAALCLAGRGRQRFVILHAHGGRLVDWAGSPRRNRLLRLAARAADRVLVVSSGLLDTLARAGVTTPVELLTNGVDTDRFHPPQERSDADADDAPVILYVGHLSVRKGVLDLLDASQRLDAAGVRHRLRLVGGVPDEGDADQDRVRSAAGPWVEFVGPVAPDRMPAVYRGADVFCLPSWWEATPLSVLEAMASGLPVVATAVGDVAAMVGDAGTVVPSRNPAELAAALSPLIQQRAARERLGVIARDRSTHDYSLERMTDRLAEIYRGETEEP